MEGRDRSSEVETGMVPPAPRISVVVPTIGRSDALNDCLTSVLAFDPSADEVLVVDGGSQQLALPDSVGYLRSAPGLTRQRNAALAAVTGDVVLFLDDDVVVSPDALRYLRSAYSDGTVVGATGRVFESSGRRIADKDSRLRRLLFGGGREGGFTKFGYPRRAIDQKMARDVSFMQGCFMSARRDAAVAVGFDENLPGYGLAEDEDFSYRLSRTGRIRFLPEIAVYHRNLGFLRRDHRRFGRDVVINRAYLFKKNFPQTARARFGFSLYLLVLLGHRLVNREWDGARGVIEGMIELSRKH